MGLAVLGVSMSKNKYLILLLLAGDINGIYVKFIRIYVVYSQHHCMLPHLSIAPKIQNKTPIGQIGHVGTRMWSIRISVVHILHMTNRGFHFLLVISLHILGICNDR